ncbi:EXORDIUM protein [Nymphaea thermarum]|nr:EXORDIUM protein [Nymphaea thermarum]
MVINPFGNGYFQGPQPAASEVISACPGVYSKEGYLGYVGELLKNPDTDGICNAHGANGRKHLLPVM